MVMSKVYNVLYGIKIPYVLHTPGDSDTRIRDGLEFFYFDDESGRLY